MKSQINQLSILLPGLSPAQEHCVVFLSKMMMSDFYIKLPSNGSKQEYPNNKSNSFKICLPEPIRLGPDWRVGLTSISLPDTNGVLPKFTLNDEPLFTMKWFVTKKKLGEASRESPTFRVKQREENFTSQNLSVNFGGLDGVGFMKTVVNFFETQRLMLGHANTDVLKGWRPAPGGATPRIKTEQ